MTTRTISFLILLSLSATLIAQETFNTDHTPNIKEGSSNKSNCKGPCPKEKNANAYDSNSLQGRISVGAMAETKQIYPFFQIQQAISDHIALGIKPFFAILIPDQDETLNQFGLFLNAAYYLSSPCFKGFFAETGVGMHYLHATQDELKETIHPLALSLSAGWQGFNSDRLSLSLGGGVQYILRDKLPTGSFIEFGGAMAHLFLRVEWGFK